MKFYKTLKDSFLWDKGTILKNQNEGKYIPVDSIFYNLEDCDEYISAKVIETQPEWFERVYEVNLLTKVIYRGKEEAKALFQKEYKE